MKALTILQPYAALICLPESDPRHKRVENRNWSTGYRGKLLIHAGRSRSRLSIEDNPDREEEWGLPVSQMAFGAIVASCRLIDCVRLDFSEFGGFGRSGYFLPTRVAQRYPWMVGNEHVEGPWCWILADVVPFASPIPYRGAQGLFDIPDAVVEAVLMEGGAA